MIDDKNTVGKYSCDACQDYSYDLLSCCDGRECGCLGMPVDAKPCSECNSKGDKPASQQFVEDWPYFFQSAD